MTQEALKLVLPLLEDCVNSYGLKYERPAFVKAIATIKEALAQPAQELTNIARHEANVQKFLGAPQPEQEPVAWRFTGIAGLKRYMTQKHYDAQTPEIKKWYEPFKCKNCTTPPQRKPLTDEQIKTIIQSIDPDEQYMPPALRQFARAIEAAHGIKE